MARMVTIARFEAWKLIPENVDGFFALLEGSEDREPICFRDACMELKLPYMLMYRFVHDSEALKGRYEAVLAALADRVEHEALQIADDVAPDRDHVAKAKLQVDTRHALASKWNRERYGETLKVEKTVTHTLDAGLIGEARDLLKIAKAKALPVIDVDVVESEKSTS